MNLHLYINFFQLSINNYRPVALTSVAMKCLEKLVLGNLLVQTETVYKNKSTEDAVLVLLNLIYKHLYSPNTYVRSLFIDYVSAFDTIQPHLMINKLLHLNVPSDLCLRILDFPMNHKQFVKVDYFQSSMCTLNTGIPQGCVTSPVLFIIYTNDLRSADPNTALICR